MNCFYAKAALSKKVKYENLEQYAEILSKDDNADLRQAVEKHGLQHGMLRLSDTSGTNIGVQIFDVAKVDRKTLPDELLFPEKDIKQTPVIIVMDYAFGEQAYETMDELLKPYLINGEKHQMNIKSINIMGKAGILEGENALNISQFEGHGLGVYEGNMITVLGTSLQNKDILTYFLKSSWKAVGLEMEGAHYQKAVQAARCIRKSISPDVKLRYAYYASDNPLETGSTLASGSLGLDGVKPTYLITLRILQGCLE
jgi:hypothetical protein